MPRNRAAASVFEEPSSNSHSFLSRRPYSPRNLVAIVQPSDFISLLFEFPIQSDSTTRGQLNSMPSCPSCNRRFGTQHGLEMHQRARRHSYCSECSRFFVHEQALSQHDDALHAFLCNASRCERVLRSSGALQKHQNPTAHLYCRECDRFFKYEDALTSTLNIHRNIPDSSATVIVNKTSAANMPWSITFATRSTADASNLLQQAFVRQRLWCLSNASAAANAIDISSPPPQFCSILRVELAVPESTGERFLNSSRKPTPTA